MDLFFRTILMALVVVAGPEPGRPSTSTELESLWSDLGTDDPVKARNAITALVAKPALAVPFLQNRLRLVPRPEPSRLARLIADLDSKEYNVRQSATRELERLAEPAEATLRRALTALLLQKCAAASSGSWKRTNEKGCSRLPSSCAWPERSRCWS